MAPLTILIIDDDRRAHTTARLAANVLAEQRDEDVHVITAISALEGAEILQSPTPIDLVLLDIHLPGHIDGRLASGLIGESRPGVRLLAFTADRTEQTARHLAALGLGEPAIKPISPELLAERIAQVLALPSGQTDTPLQDFLAGQARLVADLALPAAARRELHVGLLAREHLPLLGLTTLLHDVGHIRPLHIDLATTQSDEFGQLVRQRGLDLLVSAGDSLEIAEQLVRAHGIPLLIYTTAQRAAAALERPHSVVVGPTSTAELDQAIAAALVGERYRTPLIEGVLSLTPRQHQIVRRLGRGETTAQVAHALGLSEPRLRHLIGVLYTQLNVNSTREALIAWAHAAPLHVLAESS